jgi:2'-5' RNA ligase
MSRRLFAVALLPPGDLATRLDGLRTVLGDPRRADLPSHLTLVPPIDLDEAQATTVHGALRAAASRSSPFVLALGPCSSFAPRTSTLHLSVHGEVDRLADLRAALRRPPWDRPDMHDFVPHVTLLQRAEPEEVGAGLLLMDQPLGEWPVGSVHLLERLRPSSGAVWHPVAEEPLGGPRIVGRGGVELRLRAIGTLEPSVADLVAFPSTGPLPAGADVLVATAEPADGAPGAPVAAAIGRAGSQGAVLERLVVAPARRRQGIARHVLAAWCDAAVARGAGVVATRPMAGAGGPVGDVDPEQVLSALGFRAVDATTWCRRVGPLGELGSPS